MNFIKMDPTEQDFEIAHVIDAGTYHNESNVSEHEGFDDSQSGMSKYIETNQTIVYRKLVVPQSMRSIYWKFFGFPADDSGDILTRLKIVCLLCKTQIAYNRNTSNLRMHLNNKHSKELEKIEAKKPPTKTPISKDKKDKRDKKEKKEKKFLRAIMATSKEHIFTTDAAGSVCIKSDHPYNSHNNSSVIEQSLENQTDNTSPVKPLQVVINNDDTSTSNTPKISFILPNEISQSINKSVSEAILEFLIMDLQLPEIVQQQGFQRLIATLKTPCQIPDRNCLETKIIPNKYEVFKETIMSNIAALKNEVSLAIEEWISKNGEHFFTFIIFYQMPGESCLESKILCTIHGPLEWDIEQWCNSLDSILNEWNLKTDKITAVVASTDRLELISALTSKNLIVIPCLLHTLQMCAQACFNDYEISAVLNKCRHMIGALISHPDSATTFFEQEQLLEIEENTLTMDSPTLWTTTYNMLQQMILRREILTSFFNCTTILESSSILDEEQWQIIIDLVEVLEPFKVTIITLSEEKMPLMSLLKPLLWRLVSSHLKVKESDTATARALKESLAQMLFEKYSDSKVNLTLQLATSLDPRFKEVPYATEDDKKRVHSPIKQMLTQLIEERGDATETSDVQPTPPSKKSRLSGMEFLLGGVQVNKKSMSASNKAELELAQYQSEPSASLDNCPIQWWAKESVKCPNLGKIASRYNCVPVCAAPPSRIPVDVQASYSSKRADLPPHLIDKMLFLHANYNLT